MMIEGLREHQNRICIYLSIIGDEFDPAELTQKIGIKPTDTYLKGDLTPQYKSIYRKPGTPPNRWKATAWEYSLGDIHTIDSDDISNVLEATFKAKVPLINEFVHEHDLVVKLFVVLKIDPEQTPAVGFSRSFIKLLASLDAEIDMDIYVIDPEDTED